VTLGGSRAFFVCIIQKIQLKKQEGAKKLGTLTRKPSTNGDFSGLIALDAMKSLVTTIGAERVTRIVDILG
jgi:hypothetical protein